VFLAQKRFIAMFFISITFISIYSPSLVFGEKIKQKYNDSFNLRYELIFSFFNFFLFNPLELYVFVNETNAIFSHLTKFTNLEVSRRKN